jgi:hypothetical protein
MGSDKRIEDLLRKYWNAETSLEEEAEIKAWFSQNSDVLSSGEKAYFSFLENESNIKAPSRLHKVPQTDPSPGKHIYLKKYVRIAAAVLLLITAGYFVQQEMQESQKFANLDSFENPEMAYEEARQALLLVSEKMNKTRSAAREKIRKTDTYTQIIK